MMMLGDFRDFDDERQPRSWRFGVKRLGGVAMTVFGGILDYAFIWGMVDLTKETAPEGLALVFCHLLLDIFGLLGLICMTIGITWILDWPQSRLQRLRSLFVSKLLLVGGAVSLITLGIILFGMAK